MAHFEMPINWLTLGEGGLPHLVTRDNLLEELDIGEGVEEETVEPILQLQQGLYVSIGLLALFIC